MDLVIVCLIHQTQIIVILLLLFVKVLSQKLTVWTDDNFSVTMLMVDAVTTPNGNCSHGQLRLVNGSNTIEGRLEICVNSAWGSVCGNSFSSDDANVACRVLSERHSGIDGMMLHTMMIAKYMNLCMYV